LANDVAVAGGGAALSGLAAGAVALLAAGGGGGKGFPFSNKSTRDAAFAGGGPGGCGIESPFSNVSAREVAFDCGAEGFPTLGGITLRATASQSALHLSASRRDVCRRSRSAKFSQV
jgi:hypothetical protein